MFYFFIFYFFLFFFFGGGCPGAPIDPPLIFYISLYFATCQYYLYLISNGARCSSMVRAFAHGVMGRRIDLSWGEPTELFLVPASAPRLV